jgi:hypothetical protein
LFEVYLNSISDVPDERNKQVASDVLKQIESGAEFPLAMRSSVSLLTYACDMLDVSKKSNAYKKVVALSLREKARNEFVLHARAEFLRLCEKTPVVPLEIRGAKFGSLYYPHSDLRHTHALRFAIFDSASHRKAVAELMQAGWQRRGHSVQADAHLISMASPMGVELELYQRLLPHSKIIPDATTQDDPAFLAALLLCQAKFGGQFPAHRWLIDLAFMCSGEEIDSARTVQFIQEFGLAGTCSRMLSVGLELLPGSGSALSKGQIKRLFDALQSSTSDVPRDSKQAAAALKAYTPRSPGFTRRILSFAKRGFLSNIRQKKVR